MAFVPAMATSYSGTPSVMAATEASPPRSPIRAPCLMSSISSADLTIRCRIVGWRDVDELAAGQRVGDLGRAGRR